MLLIQRNCRLSEKSCVTDQTWKKTTPVPDSLSRLGKLGAGLACCRQASLPHFVSYYPLHHCCRLRRLLRWTPDIRVPLGKLWPLLWQGLGAASRSGITNSFSGINENNSVLTNIQSRLKIKEIIIFLSGGRRIFSPLLLRLPVKF